MGKVGLTFSGVGPNVTKRIQIWPKCPYRTYIVDEQLIEIVVKQISEDLKTENAFIFEASPGRGKLTKALLEAGAQRIRAFVDEGGHKFIDDLKDLESKYPSNLEICDSDLIEINRTIKKDSLKGTSTLPALFASVPIHSWSDPLPVKMIIPLTPIIETKFLRPLFIQMAHLTGIFTCGRAQILTFVSCYEYSYMKGNAEQRNLNNYRSSSVLYNTFFDVEFLAEVPWDCFEPKIGTNSNKLKKQKVSSAFMVRLTPRKDLPEKLPTIYWLDYIFFVQQAMTKRTAYILAFLELVVDFILKNS
ncbi:dimethyladenosine transferase 2: mitochondrial-like isoform X3 [Dinothrombium tinctorium]|uniref:rRNA adenine N(6)-methyltransferase n=1 Tax=Dinothrombium tinctorium TaxID=1965070 RepID=A0A3S3PRE1_9ACAR|nr:dimethyladenosine transferase 2: mitochondrial-like isoform X3 [Dinothrombium tinctorium]